MKKIIFLLLIILAFNIKTSIAIDLTSLPDSITKPSLIVMKSRKFNEEFLEKTLRYADLSFVSFPFCEQGPPKSPYILSADVRPQFLFGGVKSKSVALHLVPRFKVRQFRDESKPVRTPSFMPGFSFYVKSNGLNELNNNYYHYFGLTFSHHSNGQDGPALNANGSYNTHDGTFSTNFFELSYQLSKTPKKIQNNTLIPYNEWYSKFGYEYHAFGLEEEMKGRFGRNRLNLKLGLISNKVYEDVVILKESGGQKLRARPKDKFALKISEPYHREFWRAIINVSLIGDGIIGSELSNGMDKIEKRINADLSLTYRLPGSQHVGIMATGGYYGSDPYNSYFENSFFFWRLGFSFGNFGASKYKDLYEIKDGEVVPIRSR